MTRACLRRASDPIASTRARDCCGAATAARGFTLVELLVVVAIAGIGVAIAYPSFTDYIAQGRRAQATAQLLAANQWMERFYSENLRYDQNSAGTATSNAGVFGARFSTVPPPGEGTAVYNLSITTLTREGYVVTATRTGRMANDRCGNLTINHRGERSIAAGTFTGFANLQAAVQRCWRQ